MDGPTSRTFTAPSVPGGHAESDAVFVAGAFHAGKATLTMSGGGAVLGGPVTFSRVVGINIR